MNDTGIREELFSSNHRLKAFGIIPRPWQLEAAGHVLQGKHIAVIAGTGSGKTMAIILPLLARPTFASLTISPLKRLMDLQVDDLQLP